MFVSGNFTIFHARCDMEGNGCKIRVNFFTIYRYIERWTIFRPILCLKKCRHQNAPLESKIPNIFSLSHNRQPFLHYSRRTLYIEQISVIMRQKLNFLELLGSPCSRNYGVNEKLIMVLSFVGRVTNFSNPLSGVGVPVLLGFVFFSSVIREF